MINVLNVALDLLREAIARKWIIALAIGITAVLVTIGLTLRLEVVDGALSAVRLFGNSVDDSIQSVDVALRPLFRATSGIIFYGGLLFGILSCSDYGPSLLAPGRIEHQLALPVRRWQLIAGTYLGVWLLAVLGSLYGSVGLLSIIGFKTGHWQWSLILSGLLAAFGFGTLYAAMLLASLFARSAAVCGAAGGLTLIAGMVAGNRSAIAGAFDPGPARSVFEVITAVLPRMSQIGDLADDLVCATTPDGAFVARLLGGAALFTFALLALAVWRFERKDF